MLKKLLTGGLAAGAMAVPLAGLAWADPVPNPTPPVPGANAQGPAAQGPAASGANPASEPTCVVSQNTPVQAPAGNSTSPAGEWRQVATLQGSVASDLGMPPGQTVKVFCAPASTQNPGAQPTGFGLPGQQGAPGTEQGAPQNPLIPGQPPAPQNPLIPGMPAPAPGQ